MNSEESIQAGPASLIRLFPAKKFITKKELAESLGQTCSGVDKLRTRDITFPKPLRYGTSRQCRVYFDKEEVGAWLRAKMDQREVAA